MKDISIEKIEVNVANRGHITNCYLIYDKKRNGIIIDPGYDENKIIDTIKKNEVNVKYIILTHAHGDHIGAVCAVQKYTNAYVMIHEDDYLALIGKCENYSEMLGVDIQNLPLEKIQKIKEGNIFTNIDFELEIIHTPGHTAGSICIYLKEINALFTGDTVFADCYGRCDLFSGSFSSMVNSIKKIFERFDDVIIYPGHDKIVNIKKAKKYIRLLMAMKGINL